MLTKDAIIEIILKSLDEINKMNNSKIQLSVDTKLFGSNSSLDSLGFVNLITSIEENIEELTGNYIPIADEKAFSLESSPFKSVETLATFIETLINE